MDVSETVKIIRTYQKIYFNKWPFLYCFRKTPSKLAFSPQKNGKIWTKIFNNFSKKNTKVTSQGCQTNIWESLFHLFINLSFCEQLRSLQTLLFTFFNTICTIKMDSDIHYLILGNQCLEQCSQPNLMLRTNGTLQIDSNIHYLILGNQSLEQCSQRNLTLRTIWTIRIR